MLKYTLAYCEHTLQRLQNFTLWCWIIVHFIGISIPVCQIFKKPEVWLFNAIIAGVLLICFISSLICKTAKGRAAKKKAKENDKKIQKTAKVIKVISQICILITVGYGIYCTEKSPTILSYLPLIITASSALITIISCLIAKSISDEITLFIDAIQMDMAPLTAPLSAIHNQIQKVTGHPEAVADEMFVSPKNRRNLEKWYKQRETRISEKRAETLQQATRFFDRLLSPVSKIFHAKKKHKASEVERIEEPIAEQIAEALPSPTAVPSTTKKSKIKLLVPFLNTKKKKSKQPQAVSQEEHAEV